MPRYDLIRLDKYKSMPIQFSRGCPFQCEFCDIITIYGRRPRTKTTAQLIAELNTLRRLGWRDQVFIVDDNFIGNYSQALLLARDLTVWQQRNERPFSFYTEASIDLADRPELLAAMVEANFMCVFIGIETPSGGSAEGIPKISEPAKATTSNRSASFKRRGLWVLGGFIVGFDSDDESIFSTATGIYRKDGNRLGYGGRFAGAAHDRAVRPDEEGRPSDREQPGNVKFQRSELPHHVAVTGAPPRVEHFADWFI